MLNLEYFPNDVTTILQAFLLAPEIQRVPPRVRAYGNVGGWPFHALFYAIRAQRIYSVRSLM
jgi:hypothetical protein